MLWLSARAFSDNEQLTSAATLTITTGGTSQVVFAAAQNQKYLFIQNLSVENLFVNFGAAANGSNNSSIKIIPGGAYESGPSYCTTQSVNIVGATTGSAFVAKRGLR
jgi:hypothetical protein